MDKNGFYSKRPRPVLEQGYIRTFKYTSVKDHKTHTNIVLHGYIKDPIKFSS